MKTIIILAVIILCGCSEQDVESAEMGCQNVNVQGEQLCMFPPFDDGEIACYDMGGLWNSGSCKRSVIHCKPFAENCPTQTPKGKGP